MEKGRAYVPFRFKLSPIKKMAMFHFHKDPDEEYVAFELQYLQGSGYGEGFRVLAWSADGYRDSYLDTNLQMSKEEEPLAVGGKGLKERVRTTFDEAYFDYDEGQLNVGFVFQDKFDRRIVLYINEQIEKDTKPLTWLPSVGNHTEKPHSMPLFFLYDFDFARKKDTEIFLSINNIEKTLDTFAFPKDFQTRYYVEFSLNTVITNFNQKGRYTLKEVEIDEAGIAEDETHLYEYHLVNGLYHLKKITIKHDSEPVQVVFDPPFPNHVEIKEAMPQFGAFEIQPSGEAGTLRGKYNVVKQQEKAVINLSFPEAWQTPKGATYDKFINSMTPNIKAWYKTYQCTQIVDLETMETDIIWNRIDPDRRADF